MFLLTLEQDNPDIIREKLKQAPLEILRYPNVHYKYYSLRWTAHHDFFQILTNILQFGNDVSYFTEQKELQENIEYIISEIDKVIFEIETNFAVDAKVQIIRRFIEANKSSHLREIITKTRSACIQEFQQFEDVKSIFTQKVKTAFQNPNQQRNFTSEVNNQFPDNPTESTKIIIVQDLIARLWNQKRSDPPPKELEEPLAKYLPYINFIISLNQLLKTPFIEQINKIDRDEKMFLVDKEMRAYEDLTKAMHARIEAQLEGKYRDKLENEKLPLINRIDELERENDELESENRKLRIEIDKLKRTIQPPTENDNGNNTFSDSSQIKDLSCDSNDEEENYSNTSGRSSNEDQSSNDSTNKDLVPDKESNDKESNDKGSNDKESNDKEPNDNEPNDKESNDNEPNDKESNDNEPNDKESNDNEPNDKELNDNESSNTQNNDGIVPNNSPDENNESGGAAQEKVQPKISESNGNDPQNENSENTDNSPNESSSDAEAIIPH